jgi:DEAD/DEAH box helicase domain-containing protein
MANPCELAERITGEPMRLIDRDGSPRGTKYFVLWNPPETDRGMGLRRSPNTEAQALLARLMERNVQSIAFTRARVVAELIYRYTRSALEEESPKLAERLRPYRGGYLAEARREIERQLFSGELLGVTATNALELGIDVGGMDACILVGFPGTIASTWQQAGRAGRRSEESLVFLVAHNEPIDQYLMRHPEFLFGKSPEHAVIDPDNVYILTNHILCAAAEMPLKAEDERFFGPLVGRICEIIEEEGMVKRVGDKWYWASSDEPARRMSLRTISSDTFSITNTTEGAPQVIGEIDGYSAFEVLYPGAVYLHAGESYLVRDLQIESQNAAVEHQETDYYTRPTVVSKTRVGESEERRSLGEVRLFFGDLEVTRQVLGFARIKHYSQENLGFSELDLPSRTLETKGLWMTFEPEMAQDAGMGALMGLKNVLLAVLPMVAMCDRPDIGANVNSDALGEPALFIYDRYPGGLGFSQKGYQSAEKLFRSSLQLVEECTCRDGCPSCVGEPVGLGALADVGPEDGRWAESRSATLRLLRRVCRAFLGGNEPGEGAL